MEPEFADQRLPPDFCDFANVVETEPDPAGGLGAAAFFGLRTSLLECCWPLAMGDLFGLRRASPVMERAHRVLHDCPDSCHN